MKENNQDKFSTKFVKAQSKEGWPSEAAGPNAKSAFLQETRDRMTASQAGYQAEMTTLKMESQNINHEKWQDKGIREKDQSPQA